jgi:hypothetical protein
VGRGWLPAVGIVATFPRAISGYGPGGPVMVTVRVFTWHSIEDRIMATLYASSDLGPIGVLVT